MLVFVKPEDRSAKSGEHKQQNYECALHSCINKRTCERLEVESGWGGVAHSAAVRQDSPFCSSLKSEALATPVVAVA